ncbi:MAG TPA: hypothetical protein VKZ79_01410 [Alphaproteobacteria bacterium]|nr:hypothetical protein [Alphaproteobacteria bacterium]
MKRILLSLALLPFVSAGAYAAQPLTNDQMDGVTAGFTSIAVADAEGLVGESGIITTTTATLSQVNAAAFATAGETGSILYKSIAAAQSSSVSAHYSPAPIPGVSG